MKTFFWWGLNDPFNDTRACLFTVTIEEDPVWIPRGLHGVQQHWPPYDETVTKLLASGAREISPRTAFEMGWQV